ncbi:MAG: hypothetical protein C0511_13595 [Hyphomicrobium sp.]|nr:hypothetical protein [Hyphomicrobium sp.]PPC80583.1 MAG: hypothetical protein CTY40_08925 [Hyphomicrobium sp.]
MKMRRSVISLATAALILAAAPANAMNCGVVLDEITKAIAGHLTMAPEKKAAMLRMAMSTYDACAAGNTGSAEQTRDLLMKQLRESLGTPR